MNVRFLQPKSYEEKAGNEQPVKLIKKEVSAQPKQKCAELIHLQQYRCPLVARVSHRFGSGWQQQ